MESILSAYDTSSYRCVPAYKGYGCNGGLVVELLRLPKIVSSIAII